MFDCAPIIKRMFDFIKAPAQNGEFLKYPIIFTSTIEKFIVLIFGHLGLLSLAYLPVSYFDYTNGKLYFQLIQINPFRFDS